VCVPAIRKAVAEWREHKYKGASDTSKLLLNYWFATDHRMLGSDPFAYYLAQREAVETLIYLFEVATET
jgi:type III restriction enzyme